LLKHEIHSADIQIYIEAAETFTVNCY